VNEFLMLFLTQAIWQLPFYIVWITGMILAAVYWRKHRWVSLTTLIGLAIFFVFSVLGISLSTYVQSLSYTGEMPMAQMGIIYTVSGIIVTAADTAAWILVLVAIFGWRKAGQAEKASMQPPVTAPPM